MRILLLSSLSIIVIAIFAGCSAPPQINKSAANIAVSSLAGEAQRITIESQDRVILIGSFFGSQKPNSPGILLLHQWQSDRHSYDVLARKLQARGVNVLSIDGRGFGESTKRSDGTVVAEGRSDEDVRAMFGDIEASLEYLKNQPGVNSKRIGIVGASYGSSLAVIYAADHPEISTVALLSPGLNYFGNMPTETAVRKIEDDYPNRRRLIFLAAEDDKESADAVRKLNPIRVDNRIHAQRVYSKGGHGTDLLKVGADQDISNFFADAFDLANLGNLKD